MHDSFSAVDEHPAASCVARNVSVVIGRRTGSENHNRSFVRRLVGSKEEGSSDSVEDGRPSLILQGWHLFATTVIMRGKRVRVLDVPGGNFIHYSTARHMHTR
eukprot:GHVU01219866.1.p9 GENE.GHVU01219866.1~~GHVU01219866.1.p9  ORF type:complete len:103 (+),score=9.01 GHVU01219866.1:1834-2142(+)